MDTDIKLRERNRGKTADRENQEGSSFDLTFSDLSYTVGKGETAKQILKQISGTFNSGKLTAIMGPSGAGKTSLMNILAGLKKSGMQGRVDVNGAERKFKTFRKQSAYITQQDHLLSNLSVEEYMISAAHLKLGNDVCEKEKNLTIELIMKTLGLTNSLSTRVSCLSGGECKRLAIGLELIDNPSILFLDEPTSGLDSSSSLQCVAVLRDIARTGRTVVATIHQPSTRLLDQFDQLYIVAGGSCMYQGPVNSLIPYLQSMNLSCPDHHNPADFAIDVASGEYGDVVLRLISGIENGRRVYQNNSSSSCLPSSSHDTEVDEVDETDFMINSHLRTNKRGRNELSYSAPFHTQVTVLLRRTWCTIWREQILTTMRLTLHVCISILIGLVYWQIGNDAHSIYNNAGMLFFSLIFILYAAMMPTFLTFNLEREVLIREHLNRWYSLKAYYLAKTLADIPFQIFFPTVYLIPVYLMTNQPLCIERFLMLWTIAICISLVGQGIGLFFGAAFDIPVASYFAPISCIPFLLVSGFMSKFDAIPAYLNWITYLSFLHYSFEGSMLSLYGGDRPPLSCSHSYCHFRYPIKFLELFDLNNSSYYFSVLGMMANFFVIRVAGYLVLRFKLRHVR
ncbi:ATP-binding cassette sub-family G member 1-like [Daphnia carinata]|uniref:ATP-binding cassette sub-family G member 1-like n=1 Tax=Daphnia carinata TaxID=120202 RepID=UPI0025809F0A|nr:ATP-binding cassette sub-family G member 1-like [Daphnia carinata]XP_059351268.1 ATP-binding cassette sub-family G member 1-like [Daphnia carinata]XP_059351269.1 ATP-binding cassette sub-family G member 1-like [Daphnia carinata]XP_059351270.1 ATP-binding cassette sub-family G member 1-like [Daphnia carinata]